MVEYRQKKGDDDMESFEEWLDFILCTPLPQDIMAVNFNLYEQEDWQWSVEFAGTEDFDANDSDWACEEVFVTRETPYTWIEEADWNQILMEMSTKLTEYLRNGKYADKLKAYAGVGGGFVDGDIQILYEKK